MSDEEMKRSMGSAIEPPSVGSSEYTPTPDPTPLNENEGLRAKLRLYDEEELLMIRRPSLFAFMPAYLVGLGVLAIHLFFGWAQAPEDATFIESVFYFLVEVSGWAGGAGFAFVIDALPSTN